MLFLWFVLAPNVFIEWAALPAHNKSSYISIFFWENEKCLMIEWPHRGCSLVHQVGSLNLHAMALSLTFDPILVHSLHVRPSGCIHTKSGTALKSAGSCGMVVRHGYVLSKTAAIAQVASWCQIAKTRDWQPQLDASCSEPKVKPGNLCGNS